MSLKGIIFTKIKKTMTKRMYRLYYTEHKDAAGAKEAYEAGLSKAYKHLDACKFKEKGWPCPTCPECCFRGKDHDDMMTVMNYAEKWASEHPEKAGFLRPPKSPKGK